MDTCSLCDKKIMARGWCSQHYSIWNRHGDPLWEPPSLYQRFWDKVNITDDCWEWTASLRGTGYGAFSVPRPQGGFTHIGAHQFSYWLCVGDVPAGYELDHLCRNRKCVNPQHLEAVPHRLNMLRSTSPVADNALKTHCPQGHPYAGENLMIKHSARYCRTCERARWNDWYRRRSEEINMASSP